MKEKEKTFCIFIFPCFIEQLNLEGKHGREIHYEHEGPVAMSISIEKEKK